MADLYLDTATGDLYEEQDDLVEVDDERDVAQEALLRLQMWKGEWFLDVEQGLIDRERWLAINEPNLPRIRAEIRAEMLKVNGSLSVATPVLAIEGEVLRVTIDMLGNAGPLRIEAEI